MPVRYVNHKKGLENEKTNYDTIDRQEKITSFCDGDGDDKNGTE